MEGADRDAKIARNMCGETTKKLISANAELIFYRENKAVQKLTQEKEELENTIKVQEETIKNRKYDITKLEQEKQKLINKYHFLLGRKQLNEQDIDRLQNEKLNFIQKNNEQQVKE